VDKVRIFMLRVGKKERTTFAGWLYHIGIRWVLSMPIVENNKERPYRFLTILSRHPIIEK